MALTEFHTQFPGAVRWRVTPKGVEVEGSGVPRTPGNPTTVARIWTQYGEAINAAASRFGVPCAMIIATIVVESNGKADAMRTEPGYISDEATPNKVSPGLMQTLISTARGVMKDNSIDRAWLLDATNSIMAGTAVIASQKKMTQLDPPLAAAAYNSGGVYRQDGAANRWKLRQFPIGTGTYCDRYVPYLNDAVFMLTTAALRPTVDFGVLFGGGAIPVAPAVTGSAIASATGIIGGKDS